MILFFFFNDTATTEIYTLSLHDALPISGVELLELGDELDDRAQLAGEGLQLVREEPEPGQQGHLGDLDRKSTRLNSSHANISYAVFCLKKKKIHLARHIT